MCRGQSSGFYTDFFFTLRVPCLTGRIRSLYETVGDDDLGLHVLGCRVDILGTNCKKLLRVKMSGGGGGGRGGEGKSRFGFSTCSHVRGAARRLLLDKKYILSLGVHFTADKKRRPPAHS